MDDSHLKKKLGKSSNRKKSKNIFIIKKSQKLLFEWIH